MLNNPIPKVRQYFRENLTNINFDDRILISKITRNSVHFRVDKDITQAEFFSYDRQSNLIRRNFDRLLSPLHSFDMKFANPFIPILNMGYDTLTAYSATGDGYISNTNATWATCRNAISGGGKSTADTSDSWFGGTVATGYTIYRMFYYFNTTAMGAGKTISSSVFSIYGLTNGESNVACQQAALTTPLAFGDYDAFTGTYLAKTTSWKYIR